MKTNKISILVLFTLALLLITGCIPKLPATPSAAEETRAVLFAQATLTKVAVETEMIKALTPLATNTPDQPASTAQPVLLPTPTATLTQPVVPPPNLHEVRIAFEPNATNAAVMGMVMANSTQRYVFYAFKDQLIDVTLSSGQDVALSISGRDGTVLVSTMGDTKGYRGYLPLTQDWFIDIRAAGVTANFGLNLMIPERVSFASGANSITLNSSVIAGGVHNYIAKANAGQTLKVSVLPAGNLALSIYGIDGTVLMSSMGDSNTFEGSLPLTQDYIINVRSMPGSGYRSYTFTLQIQ